MDTSSTSAQLPTMPRISPKGAAKAADQSAQLRISDDGGQKSRQLVEQVLDPQL